MVFSSPFSDIQKEWFSYLHKEYRTEPNTLRVNDLKKSDLTFLSNLIQGKVQNLTPDEVQKASRHCSRTTKTVPEYLECMRRQLGF